MKKNNWKRESKQEKQCHNAATAPLAFSCKEFVRKLGALNNAIVGLSASEMNVGLNQHYTFQRGHISTEWECLYYKIKLFSSAARAGLHWTIGLVVSMDVFIANLSPTSDGYSSLPRHRARSHSMHTGLSAHTRSKYSHYEKNN